MQYNGTRKGAECSRTKALVVHSLSTPPEEGGYDDFGVSDGSGEIIS